MAPKPPKPSEPPAAKGAASGDAADQSGRTVGDFRLLRRLGEGGMGQVYLAEQLSLKRRVALKLLRTELAGNETSRKRFEAEAKAVAQLTHANIVQVYQYGDHEGQHYMALEYIDGRNLRDYVSRKGPPDLPIALSIMRQVAAALQRAAEMGIIHRDIKPENILLTRKGEVKVTDFGLSRIVGPDPQALNLTQTGVTMGTPLYMSPEQVEGRPLDHRTDIYSFGVSCYHMLAGQPPFEGENAFAVALQHVQTDPIPLTEIRPDLPPAVCGVVMKMMAKQPEDRYQSAREIVKDLRQLGDGKNGGLVPLSLPDSAAKTSTLPHLPAAAGAAAARPRALPAPIPEAKKPASPSSPSRRRLQIGVAVSLLLAVVGGGALGNLLGKQRRPAPTTPVEETSKDEGKPTEAPVAEAHLGTYKQQEQAFKALVETSKSPGNNRDQIIDGLRYRVKLGMLYLNNRDLDDEALDKAEAFFKQQRQHTHDAYQAVGKLGEALVSAFRGDPKGSFAAFREFDAKYRGLPGGLWSGSILRDADVIKLVSKAIEHNVANAKMKGVDLQEKDVQDLMRRFRIPFGGPPVSPT